MLKIKHHFLSSNKDDLEKPAIPSEAITSEEATKITGQELDNFFKKGREFKEEAKKKITKEEGK